MPRTPLQLLSGQHAVDFLTTTWMSLYNADPAATPFQSPDWLIGWAQNLPARTVPFVAVVNTSSGMPATALALERHQPTNGPARLRPLSSPHAEYVLPTGPYSNSPRAVSMLCAILQQLPANTSIELSDVPLHSALARCLAHTSQWTYTTAACAAISLPLHLANPELAASTRRTHRRRHREWSALTAAGRVTYSRTRSTEQLLSALPSLATLHRLRWAPAEEQTPGSTHDFDQWFKVLARCGSSSAAIATLSLDHLPVAAQLCVFRNGTCYSLIPAWNPAFKALAPGHALLRRLADDLAEESDAAFHTLNLGRTLKRQVPYKAQYAPKWNQTLTFARRPIGDLFPAPAVNSRRNPIVETAAARTPGRRLS